MFDVSGVQGDEAGLNHGQHAQSAMNKRTKGSGQGIPDWQRYERLVARLIADQLSTDYCVTPNAKVIGKVSNARRQIDVLIDLRHITDNRQRIIIDAKARSRPVDITHVETFIGLMADVGATHGYLVCPLGHTPAAERRAQDNVSIRLLPLDQLENFDPTTWPKCLATSCGRGRVFWDGYQALDLLLAPFGKPQATPEQLTFIHYLGKCDRCARFHVKCMACGDLLSPPHDDPEDHGLSCSCRNPWFWLASIEEADDGTKSAELHLVTLSQISTVNRRSL